MRSFLYWSPSIYLKYLIHVRTAQHEQRTSSTFALPNTSSVPGHFRDPSARLFQGINWARKYDMTCEKKKCAPSGGGQFNLSEVVLCQVAEEMRAVGTALGEVARRGIPELALSSAA